MTTSMMPVMVMATRACTDREVQGFAMLEVDLLDRAFLYPRSTVLCFRALPKIDLFGQAVFEPMVGRRPVLVVLGVLARDERLLCFGAFAPLRALHIRQPQAPAPATFDLQRRW